ncbi:MAG: AAA family ATPase [Deltaproteobacteria bacterium]|nr:AAA family ATPase [Deltaproteobacteria bacterium]
MIDPGPGPVFRSSNFALPAGATFADRYRIIRVAGAGGMGRIYEATDDRTGARVALKTTNVSGVDSLVAERFQREIEILRAVRHENLVGAIDSGRDREGSLFLALEWLDGGDLGDRLARGPMSVEEACRVGRGALRGLQAVHDAKIVHRDMKPGNIFLVRNVAPPRGVKLLDFGVAKLLEDQLKASGGGLTLEGTVIGTPYYMSPEQAQGRDDVDARADLFSLGAVLFECMCGQRPFAGSSALALLLRIASERPRSIREVDPTIPARVAEFFERALARDRAQRFQTAKEMEAALDEVEQSATIAEPPTSTSFRPDRAPFQWHSVGATTEPQAIVDLATLPPEPIAEPTILCVMVAELIDDAFPAFAKLVTSERGEAMPVRGRVAVGLFDGDDAVPRAIRVAREVVVEQSRIALRAAVGSSAPDDRDQGVRAGEAIESAVALISLGKKREVVMDAETHRALGATVPTRPRGMDARVVSESAELDAWSSGDFVGRKSELDELTESFERCASTSSATFVLVVGPSASGKSRLADELARKVSRGPYRAGLLKSYADRSTARTPLFVFSDALRRRASILQTEREVTIAAKLDLLVPKNVGAENRDRAMSAVARLVGVGERSQHSTGGRSAARSFPSLLRALIGLAREGPLALILEDAEWIDPASAAVIEELLDAGQSLPLFIAAFAEPIGLERLPRLTALARRIELSPVDDEALEALARSMRPDVPDAAITRVVKASEGRPGLAIALLYAPELAKEATGAEQALDSVANARVATLPPDLLETLVTAAVVGMTFWEDALAALGLSDIKDTLDILAAEGFIEARDTSRYAHTRELVFRGEAIWRAAYARQPRASELHRKAAGWIRSMSGSCAEAIARHLISAGSRAEAATWVLDAARAALLASDPRSAEEITRLLANSNVHPSVAIDLIDVRATALELLADFDNLSATLDAIEARDLAPSRKLSNRARRARFALKTGDLAHALRLYRELLPELEGQELIADAADADLGAQEALQERGESALAVPFAEAAYAAAKKCELPALEARALLALGRLAFATADLGQALRIFEQAKAKAIEADDRLVEGYSYRWTGAALVMAGSSERADEELLLAERRLGAIPDVAGALEARIWLANRELDPDQSARIQSLGALHAEAQVTRAPIPILLSGVLLARAQLDLGLEVEAAALGDALLSVAHKKSPRFLCALESTVGIAEARLGAPTGKKRVEAAIRRMEAQHSSELEEPFRIYAHHAEILEREGLAELAQRQWRRTEQILREVEARLPSALRPGFSRRPVVRGILDRKKRS